MKFNQHKNGFKRQATCLWAKLSIDFFKPNRQQIKELFKMQAALFLIQTHCVTIHQSSLEETIPMNCHKKGLTEILREIFAQLVWNELDLTYCMCKAATCSDNPWPLCDETPYHFLVRLSKRKSGGFVITELVSAAVAAVVLYIFAS